MIADEIEKNEGFQVDYEEYEDLKCYHYGTLIGYIQHQGAYIEVDKKLINELNKYELDLEAYLVEQNINYEVIKGIKIYVPKIKPDVNLGIKWDGWYCPNSGTINGNYFCYRCNQYRGNYIELIYNHRPYYSYWKNLPDHVKPYFDKIWQELKETNYIRHPKEIRLGSKVANYLPDGYKAYKTDNDDQCRVARNTHKYCYIKRFRDCVWYVSPTDNYQLMAKQTDSMKTAISEALKMINEM